MWEPGHPSTSLPEQQRHLCFHLPGTDRGNRAHGSCCCICRELLQVGHKATDNLHGIEYIFQFPLSQIEFHFHSPSFLMTTALVSPQHQSLLSQRHQLSCVVFLPPPGSRAPESSTLSLLRSPALASPQTLAPWPTLAHGDSPTRGGRGWAPVLGSAPNSVQGYEALCGFLAMHCSRF